MSIHMTRPQPRRGEAASAQPPITAFLVPIARDASAIVFDRPARATPTDRRARLTVFSGDGAVRGPVVSTEIETQNGAIRHLALIDTAAEQMAVLGASVLRGDRRIATLDADWLQSPVRTSSSLFHDLAFRGRARLLKLLLANAASLFHISEDPAFARMVADLAGQTAMPEIRIESICESGRGVILTLALSDEARDMRHAHIALVTPSRVGLVFGASLFQDASTADDPRDNERIHIHLPRAPGRRSRLIGFCGAATTFVADLDHMRVIPFAQWLRRASPAAQAWGRQRFHATGQTSTQPSVPTRVTGDALESGVENDPGFTLHSASATEAGVLLAADITDPLGQMRSVIVERGDARAEIAIGVLAGGAQISATTPLCGFFETRQEKYHTSPSRIRLAYHNGRVQTVVEQHILAFSGAPDAVLARPGAGESLNTAIRRAAIALSRAATTRERAPVAVRTTRFGKGGGDKCKLTLVAPMPCDPDVLRVRSAAVCAEGDVDVGFVYHWASHADDAARLAAIEDAHAVYGYPYLAVVTESRATEAERLQSALRMTCGPVLLLGASVLPSSSGWLAPWMKGLAAASPVSVIGATLVSVHGGALDSGGRVTVNPVGELVVTPRATPARTRRGTGGVTGSRRTAPTGWASAAAVGLKPAAVNMICNSTTPLRDPDFLIAETIARLKACGSKAVTMLHAPFADFAGRTQPDPLSAAVDSILLADSLRAIGETTPHSHIEASR